MKEEDKIRLSFEYEGNNYTGYLVSSTDILPHFHWFMFDDEKVITVYGDSIAFKMENEELVPLYHMTFPGFVAAVHDCVKKYLMGDKKLN